MPGDEGGMSLRPVRGDAETFRFAIGKSRQPLRGDGWETGLGKSFCQMQTQLTVELFAIKTGASPTFGRQLVFMLLVLAGRLGLWQQVTDYP